MRVLVTGATGFVGSALVKRLVDTGRFDVRAAIRRDTGGLPLEVEHVVVGDLTPVTLWQSALAGVAAVVHLAARAHVMRDTAGDPLAEFRRVNVGGTLHVARQAVAAGVRRFVFLSSVKVNGEGLYFTPNPFSQPLSQTGREAYKESDPPAPQDAYAISKHEAELGLRQIAAETGLEVIVLRTPLVYGPGVKGNFLRLMNLVSRGVPLPLGSVTNRRSLIFIGNLVDAIIGAIDDPQAAGRTYFVSDGEDVSTPDLIRGIARALEVQPRLFPCPPLLLKIAGMLSGRGAEVARLIGSFQVDSARIRGELRWNPRFRLEHGLAETARWYRARSGAQT